MPIGIDGHVTAHKRNVGGAFCLGSVITVKLWDIRFVNVVNDLGPVLDLKLECLAVIDFRNGIEAKILFHFRRNLSRAHNVDIGSSARIGGSLHHCGNFRSEGIGGIKTEGYYTYSPSVITETTKEIVFSFRGFNVSLPITVNGVDSSEDTTGTPETPPEDTKPITPPETTQNNETDPITTQEPEVTTGPEETTQEPEVTTDTEITTAPDITTSSGEVTTDSGETTTDPGSDDDKNPVSLLSIWIIVIVIIVAALVALIIYYKKNFT